MYRTVLKIEGMHCGQCEATVCDAIRKALPVQKVKASRRHGEAVILSENPLDNEALRAALAPTGYGLESIAPAEPYEKHGFFSGF